MPRRQKDVLKTEIERKNVEKEEAGADSEQKPRRKRAAC